MALPARCARSASISRGTRSAAPPVSIAEQIAGGELTGTSQAGSLGLAVSADGTLAYVPVVPGASGRLVWVDRNGHEEALPAPPRGYVVPRISPDGSQVAIDTRDATGADIWVWHFAGRTLTRVTFGTSVYPVWSRDSGRLVHTAFDEARVGRLFLRRARRQHAVAAADRGPE